jgi:nucleoid-associated protein YgaU
VTIGGCKSWGKKNTDYESSDAMTDMYTPSAQEPAYGIDRYATYGSPAASEDTFEAAPVTTSEPRYHVVVKSDTLYGLARTYYGDHRRWKDIYEANRSVISDPNKIRIGQRLLIP